MRSLNNKKSAELGSSLKANQNRENQFATWRRQVEVFDQTLDSPERLIHIQIHNEFNFKINHKNLNLASVQS